MSTRAKWLCALLALAWLPGQAQDFPSRPLRIVVPLNAGSALDTLVRLVAEHASRELGQPLVVENRPGASGTLAAAAVARASPDGYTVLAGTVADQAVAPVVFDLPYDPRADFAPVTMAVRAHAVLVTYPGLGAADMRQLLGLAKTRPLSVGTFGHGTLTHLLARQLRDISGTEMIIIPYKSTTDAIADVSAGRIDLWFDFVPALDPYLRAGRLRALMVAGERRAASLPEVPSAAESGLALTGFASWAGFLVPAGTPPATVLRLHAAFTRALGSPAVLQIAERQSMEIIAGSPVEFAAFIREQQRAFARLVKPSSPRREP